MYTSVDALRRMQYKATGFAFQPLQPINSILAGKNVSKLRGRGLNFEEMRQYHIGDDIRTMDWKVTQRTGKPHVKVYTEERERSVYLLVDQRQSMFFGSKGKMKSVVAAEVAALIAWQVIKSTDRVGAIVFNDSKAVTLPAQRSQQQTLQIFGEIVRQNHQLQAGNVAEDEHVSLSNMFEQIVRLAKHDALVILISDGFGWDEKCGEYLKKIRQNNDMVMCHITDPLERELAQVSQMVVSDGALQVEISPKDKALQQAFSEDVKKSILSFVDLARRYRVPLLPFNTLEDTANQLRRAMGAEIN